MHQSPATAGQDPPVLSVVVPCFNEEEVIAITHGKLTETVRALVSDYEIIYVDDGSRDRTLEILNGIAGADPSARVLSFASLARSLPAD